MTPQEFKAWFDGFTEAMQGLPNESQWKKIQERVGQIDGKPVSYPVYVDRYWPVAPRRPWEAPYWYTAMSSGGLSVKANDIDEKLSVYSATLDCTGSDGAKVAFEQHRLPAMRALGKADFDIAEA